MNKLILILLFAFLVVEGFAQTDPFINVNSQADEMNPVLSASGETLYFIRKFDQDNAGGIQDPGDVWYSQITDSTIWSNPVRMAAPVNNAQFNGVIGFSPQEDRMYLYEHYMPGGTAARTQGISYSVKQGNNWSMPVRVDMKYFYNKSEHISVSISKNGDIMLLSLESYGTRGAEDLYVSFRNNNEWSEPRNLGPVINTSYQEMTPYLAPDNRTLFFASNGHGGFGGRDIFVSVRQDESWRNWSVPQNLGPKVNTEGVELYFQYFPDQEQAIYTSTQNSDGYSDLKLVSFPKVELEDIMGDTLKIPEPVNIVINEDVVEKNDQVIKPELKLIGKVKNFESQNGIAAQLFVKGRNWQQSFDSDLTDGFEIILPVQDVYQVTVKSEGYVALQETLDIRSTESATINQDFVLQPIAVGTTVKLDNVLFVRGSTELLESSYDELNLVVKMMEENPGMEIFLAGHTDNQGNARLNRILSQQRVEAVIRYLTGHGIDKARLSGKGFGGTKPVASNDTEESRRLNRRVEFTIEKF